MISMLVRAWSLLPCCFLRQDTLLHIVSLHPGVQMGTSNHNAGVQPCGGLASDAGESSNIASHFMLQKPALGTSLMGHWLREFCISKWVGLNKKYCLKKHKMGSLWFYIWECLLLVGYRRVPNKQIKHNKQKTAAHFDLSLLSLTSFKYITSDYFKLQRKSTNYFTILQTCTRAGGDPH